ncbi:shikimate dehydrogenase [Peristeroidobacter soli]|uniref:shikimate dehydrogenase n=1 Tax=Peristeroidobacter soli TaxID=2497877 RepID=UPI00101C5115|nr:shikimate dehydrogenase [Peristeroidobacter soli]
MSSAVSTETSRRVLAGLIGSAIQQSLTPALHMEEGAAQGLDYRYELLDLDRINGGVAALPSLLASAQERGLAGLNITHPCKQIILPMLDSLSDDARALGAVNTVVFSEGRRIGHNTDWWGFAESFKLGLQGAALERVVQLGAGGAGAAVAYAMLKLGAQRLDIYDIDTAKMRALVASLSELFPARQIAAVTDLRVAMAAADGLVHATTTGMAKNPGLPLPAELLRASQWVVEIIYFPLQTQLLKTARSSGCRTLDGGGMAIYQAVGAFRLFTGIAPDAQRMAQHFDSLARRPAALAAAE